MSSGAASSIVQAAFAAFDREEWEGFIELTDPAYVAEFRERQVQHARAYWRQLLPAISPVFDPARRFGVTTVEELEALSAEEVFARSLDSSRHGPTCVHGPKPDFRVVRTVLGEVKEGGALSHVIYRAVAMLDGVEGREMLRVATVKRIGGQWRLSMADGLLLRDLLGLDLEGGLS